MASAFQVEKQQKGHQSERNDENSKTRCEQNETHLSARKASSALHDSVPHQPQMPRISSEAPTLCLTEMTYRESNRAFSGTRAYIDSSQMTQCRIILLLQPIIKLYLFTIELNLRDDFRCFRSKMCFRTFSTVPLNSTMTAFHQPRSRDSTKQH